MKKILTAICSTLLVVLLAFGLTGCSKADKIKSAFENDGYTVTTATLKDNDTAKNTLKTVFGWSDDKLKEAESWELISAGKLALASPALILKFPSSGELKKFLTVEKEDGSKDTSAYDKAVEDGKVNGDCLLLAGVGNAKTLFKNA